MAASIDRPRIAVLGVGAMGEIHATNLRRLATCDLARVSDVNGERASQIGAQLGVPFSADPHATITDSDIDAVVVASSDFSHAELVLACLVAGKPVLCEKPLALTLSDAQRVRDAERTAGRRLVQLGFMREYDPAHVAVRDVVRSGGLGRPVLFRGTHINLNTAPFRMTGEEAIVKSLVHDIHSTRFLTGLEFVEVHARSVPADDDPRYTRYVAVTAQLTGNAIALLDANMESNYGYVVNAEVVGAHGTATTVAPTLAHTSVPGPSAGILSAPITTHWRQRFADAYRLEAEAWIESVRSGEATGPTCGDGYIAQVVADACCASLRTGRPVAVPTVG